MSCYVLQAESFEALAVSLAHHKIKVPSPHAPAMIATPEAWAALAWAAADSNVIAYRHRFGESADVNPLVKLLACASYQIADAPAGSEARVIGEELHRLAAEIALALVSRTEAYQAAPWGDDPREVRR